MVEPSPSPIHAIRATGSTTPSHAPTHPGHDDRLLDLALTTDVLDLPARLLMPHRDGASHDAGPLGLGHDDTELAATLGRVVPDAGEGVSYPTGKWRAATIE